MHDHQASNSGKESRRHSALAAVSKREFAHRRRDHYRDIHAHVWCEVKMQQAAEGRTLGKDSTEISTNTETNKTSLTLKTIVESPIHIPIQVFRTQTQNDARSDQTR